MSAPSELDDLALAGLPASVRAAAGTTLAASLFGFLHAIQIVLTVVFFRAPFQIVPYVMGVVAVAGLASGVGIYRARRWAPGPALAAMVFQLALSAFWFLFALFNGFLTLFGMIVPMASLIAMLFVLGGRKACLATYEARRRLAEQGLGLGI